MTEEKVKTKLKQILSIKIDLQNQASLSGRSTILE